MKIKYESSLVTFLEVPDEITLCFNITGCPCNCEGCFEPWLTKYYGNELDCAVLESKIVTHKHLTCICFMGGDAFYDDIAQLIKIMRLKFPNLKWAMYSGRPIMNEELSQLLDYYKIGPFIPKCGPLNEKTTNQRMYKKVDGQWIDITYRFQEEKF